MKKITAVRSDEADGKFRVVAVEREVRVNGAVIDAMPTERIVYQGNSFSEARAAEERTREEMANPPTLPNLMARA